MYRYSSTSELRVHKIPFSKYYNAFCKVWLELVHLFERKMFKHKIIYTALEREFSILRLSHRFLRKNKTWKVNDQSFHTNDRQRTNLIRKTYKLNIQLMWCEKLTQIGYCWHSQMLCQGNIWCCFYWVHCKSNKTKTELFSKPKSNF